MQIVAQINNLFDRRYYTAGQLGALGFTDSGAFIARPVPAANGDFPVRHATFYATGAPVRMWVDAVRVLIQTRPGRDRQEKGKGSILAPHAEMVSTARSNRTARRRRAARCSSSSG